MDTDTQSSPDTEVEVPQTEATEDKESTQVPSEGDLVAKKLISENRKYRADTRKWKEEAAIERKKREELEQAKLAEQGKFKEQAEYWKAKAKESEERGDKLMSTYANKLVSSQVRVAAQEMGCTNKSDMDLLMQVVPLSDLSDDIDEDFNAKPDAVKDLLLVMKDKYPKLFTAKAPEIEDGDPNPDPKFKTKDEAYMHELRKCTTQKEFDAVRAKYGRG